MHLRSFEQIDPQEWNSLCDHSPDAWLFHRAEWIKIEMKYFTEQHASVGVIDDEGVLCAMCPLYFRKLGRGTWIESVLDSGHHRHTGPAFRANLPAPIRKAAIKILMRHILEKADEENVDRALLNQNNLAPGSDFSALRKIPFWILDYGFEPGIFMGPQGDFALPSHYTLAADQIVDLRLDEEQLSSNLSSNFRKAIRKAEGNGLQLSIPGSNPIDAYYSLAEISAKRTGEILPDRQYYQDLWDSIAPEKRCVILTAEHPGAPQVPVAGLWLVVDKGSAAYFAGVSHHDYLPMRVNNFLHWEAVKWLKKSGVTKYRLGPIFPTLPRDWPVSCVSRFKGELGGESVPIIQGCLFRNKEKYRNDALGLMQAG